jgi:hypothetical protein
MGSCSNSSTYGQQQKHIWAAVATAAHMGSNSSTYRQQQQHISGLAKTRVFFKKPSLVGFFWVLLGFIGFLGFFGFF